MKKRGVFRDEPIIREFSSSTGLRKIIVSTVASPLKIGIEKKNVNYMYMKCNYSYRNLTALESIKKTGIGMEGREEGKKEGMEGRKE